MSEVESSFRFLVLNQYQSRDVKGGRQVAVVLLQDNVSVEKVEAAWAYAIMYSAKGLTIPDYNAAIELFKSRHPSWEFVKLDVLVSNPDLSKADGDTPEQQE